MSTLPTDSKARKDIPLARGCLDYFPAALAAVAELSRAGNEKHNPGEELHHARGKSNDHADCILRHLTDRGTVDPEDGIRHSTKVAWRALALLQEELEVNGAPLARGARAAMPAPRPVPDRLWLNNLHGHLTLADMQGYVDNFCKAYDRAPSKIVVTAAQREHYRAILQALAPHAGRASARHFDGIELEVQGA